MKKKFLYLLFIGLSIVLMACNEPFITWHYYNPILK
jgi:hypothetical protein